MIQTELEKLLAERIGLDANSIGTQAVHIAMTIRMAAINVTDAHAYLSQLRASEREFAELIENIVVSETWFYRDREAFAAMVHLLKRKEKAGFVPLRILSLPCATGEEPYSIVMAMLDAGFSPHQFRVDAIDISRNALTQAREGLYGKNSFRGSELGFRARHFTSEALGHRVTPTVRDSVEFQEGNVLDAGFSLRPDRYDAIFCRNMLIYFGAKAQDQAIRALLRCLEADGTLFVGPSETAILAEHGLVPENIPFSFAYRRREPAPNKPDQAPVPFPTTRAASPQASASKAFAPKTFTPKTFAPNAARAPVPAPVAAESTGRTLREIQLLADQGQLAEAALQCQTYLTSTGPSPETYYLLALIRDAAGDPAEAATWYRKALYLDPSHHEAMAHLSLLLEQQGDAAGAKRMKERLNRLDRGRSQ